MNDSGGMQKVIARDRSDTSQIALIQEHLQHESEEFAMGNYADPARLHGAAMPGLADLEANAGKLHVAYSALPNGAQMTFETTDLHLITAIHRWFGAQLSDHGANAKAE